MSDEVSERRLFAGTWRLTLHSMDTGPKTSRRAAALGSAGRLRRGSLTPSSSTRSRKSTAPVLLVLSGLGLIAILTLLIGNSDSLKSARRALLGSSGTELRSFESGPEITHGRKGFSLPLDREKQSNEGLSDGNMRQSEGKNIEVTGGHSGELPSQSDGEKEAERNGLKDTQSKVSSKLRKRRRKSDELFEKHASGSGSDDLTGDTIQMEVDDSTGDLIKGEDRSTGATADADEAPPSTNRKPKKGIKKRRKSARRQGCPLSYDESMVPQNLPDFPPSPFSLSYVTTASSDKARVGHKYLFGGHQIWDEREDSYFLNKGIMLDGSKEIHCGFVQDSGTAGETPEKELFWISPQDKEYLRTCDIAVVSALFGNFDQVHLPQRSKMADSTKHNVCFVLFLDAASLQGVRNDSLKVSQSGFVGLWRTVLVENLPYADNRLNGKVPKMLVHRLMPNARYSVWVDSKLRLYVDPVYALDKFLIGPKAEFAISQHYDRHCVWEEVARNKFLKKFNDSVLDEQLAAYEKDGLKPIDGNDPGRLLPSNVPEGSFFLRAHSPLSNLFSCLWFNEVNWFSSRDQVAFAYVAHKLMWSNGERGKLRLNMFRDCDRRAMVKLFHHREEEKLLALNRKQQIQEQKVGKPAESQPLVSAE